MAGVSDGFDFDWSFFWEKSFLNYLRGYKLFVSKEYLLKEHRLFVKNLDKNPQSAYFRTFHCTLPDGKLQLEAEIGKDGKATRRAIYQQTHPGGPFFKETEYGMKSASDKVPTVHGSLLKLMKKKQRATVKELSQCLNTTLKDKYFICRVIVEPQVLVSVQLVVDVPCPENDSAVRVSLYNFTQQRSNLNLLFPIGAKLIIMNPFFKTTQDDGLTLTSYKRSDVFTISDELLAEKFPEINWPNDLPVVINEVIEESDLNQKVGNEHFVNGNYLEAVDYYSRALDECPLDETLLSNRAAAYLRLDKFHEAMIDAESVLSRNPSHSKANYRCAKAYVALGKYNEAIEILEKNMPKSTKNGAREYRLLLKEAYKLKRSMNYPDELLASKLPDHPVDNTVITEENVPNQEVEDLKRMGNESFAKAKENYLKAVDYYSRALDKCPHDETLLSNRSAAYLRLDKFHEAMIDAENVLSRNPSHSKAYYRCAKAYVALGKYNEAVEIPENNMPKSTKNGAKEYRLLLKEAYKLKSSMSYPDELLASKLPDHPVNNSVIAEECVPSQEVEDLKRMGNESFAKAKENYLEAVDYYSRALDKCPLDETLLSNRSAAYLRLDKFHEAMIDAESVLSRNPSHSKANYRCAKAYVALGKYNEAVEILENNMPKCTKNGAKEYRLLLKEAYKLKRFMSNPGELLAPKQPDHPIDNTVIAEENVPNQEVEDLKRMGNESFAKAKENYLKAVDYYSRALDKCPYDETLLSNRSAAYLRLDKFHEAMIDAESVLSRNPSHSKANYRCAKAYVALGKYDAAIILLEKDLPKANKNVVKERRQLLEKAYKLKC